MIKNFANNKVIINRFLIFLLCLAGLIFSVLLLSSCSSTNKDLPDSVKIISQDPLTVEFNIEKEEEFSAIFFSDISCEQFGELGFTFGNSLDVKFSNGKTFLDIPYVDGFYLTPGNYFVCSYKLYPHPMFNNNLEGTWYNLGLSENDTVQVSINDKDKYKELYDVMSMELKKDRNDYKYDSTFGNFRSLSGGNIKEGRFYRSASPCNNKSGRAAYVDSLMQVICSNYVIDLADNQQKADSYENSENFESYYWKKLKDAGLVRFCSCGLNYKSDDFKVKVASAIKEAIGHDGPYLIHCTEGKDRTGFVCMVIEALNGATYEQLKNDYLVSYTNLFQIDFNAEPQKAKVIVDNSFNPMISFLTGTPKDSDFSSVDFSYYAKKYLQEGGMSESDIDTFKHILCD